MTIEAEKLMAEAMKRVKLGGGFDPEELGAKIGLNKAQAETAALALSNAGVLILGFDNSAHFSPAFRKLRNPELPVAGAKKKKLLKHGAKKKAAKAVPA